MQWNKKKVCVAAAVCAAMCGLSAPVLAKGGAKSTARNTAKSAAKSGTVDYTCQNDRSLRVRYQFNSAGVPTVAQASVGEAKRVMRYDMAHSDHVSTLFKDRSGYRLSAGYLDSGNYSRSNGIMITAPDDRILFKECEPKRRAPAEQPQARQQGLGDGSVAYVCQNNRRLNVRYRFNSAGIPTHATATIRGRNYTLSYDQNTSDHVSTRFTERSGYRLSAGYLDSNNFRSEGGLMVTAPDNQLIYKGCNPVR